EPAPAAHAPPGGGAARRRRPGPSYPPARRSRSLGSCAASLLVLVAACRPRAPLAERVDAALGRAGAYLVAQQGPDGAIRSKTYAYFKDGYSLTPLALAALFAVPAPDEAAYALGVDFIAGMADAKELSYPLYSMAIGTLVLNLSKNSRHDKIRQILILEIRKRQLDSKNGWDQNLGSFGGWGYYDSGLPRRGVAPDEELAANLSSTLYAIGALVLA